MLDAVSRRDLLRAGLAAGGAIALGPALARVLTGAASAAAATATPGPGPYGAPSLDTPLGIRLPAGFSVRQIARGGQRVAGTGYTWHPFTDGQAAFPAQEGGWILVSNSEASPSGGCSAIRFDRRGRVADAYRTLSGSERNCAGGPTPWGTWLSCEERPGGVVWEVDPTRERARRRPALGTFAHEAACVDPRRGHVYLTEDTPDGHLYRFTPRAYPDLSAGTLAAAVVDERTRRVTWAKVDPDRATEQARARGAKRLRGGEGAWWHDDVVYLTTKHDDRVWALDCETRRLHVRYDAAAAGPGAPLRGVDNLCVARSGDVYVCEDGDDLDLCLITPAGEVARFLTLDPRVHVGTELVGVTFDPSGTRLYVGSQRSFGLGALYEVTGPFRRPRSPVRPPAFGGAVRAGEREGGAADLVRVRAQARAGRTGLAGPGLAVRIALREPCVVRTSLRTTRRVVAEHRFPVAVTGLTALRLRARGVPPGERCEVVVRAAPTDGGTPAEVRLPLVVS